MTKFVERIFLIYRQPTQISRLTSECTTQDTKAKTESAIQQMRKARGISQKRFALDYCNLSISS